MGIRMIGIDHSTAGIDVRMIFSFTRKKTAEALTQIRQEKGINGCVLLTTCNRTELWVSADDAFAGSLYEILCRARGIFDPSYEPYFTARRENEAVRHLFRLAGGLESRILGEDQIVGQVKDALSLARECCVTDNVLEVLFRRAVTGAKKVKTEVVLSPANRSVVHHVIAAMKEAGYVFRGKKGLVIGNGETGKLAATLLCREGADVTVTVRQYRSGVVEIPEGCRRIDYGERMRLFADCDFVVSATASPNFTVTGAGVDAANLTHDLILLDLAVPRDVEPAAGEREHVRLYDIDAFQVEAVSDGMKENIARAEGILREQAEEFYAWYECRDLVPRTERIKDGAADDLVFRLQKSLRALPLSQEDTKELERQITQAGKRVTNKMLFGLRDRISREAFLECLQGLEDLYREGSAVLGESKR